MWHRNKGPEKRPKFCDWADAEFSSEGAELMCVSFDLSYESMGLD
jgi:hypothetical protein